jgi:hypothetical protein
MSIRRRKGPIMRKFFSVYLAVVSVLYLGYAIYVVNYGGIFRSGHFLP